MKKHLVIIGIVAIIFCTGIFSGCTSQTDTSKTKEYHVTYSVLGHGSNVWITYTNETGKSITIINASLPLTLELYPFHTFDSPSISAWDTEIGDTYLLVELWINDLLIDSDHVDDCLIFANASYLIPAD